MLSTRFSAFAAFLVISVTVLGCGKSGFNVTGKIEENGKPLALGEKGLVVMRLNPVEDKTGASVYPAEVNSKDGTFKVGPRTDGSLPTAGKYRFSIEIYDPYPGKDKLNGKLSGEKSPIVREITGASAITVDIAKGE